MDAEQRAHQLLAVRRLFGGWHQIGGGCRGPAWFDLGLIYTSSNSGATWTPTSAPSNSWSSVATSADGTKLFAAATSGSVYTSSIYTSTNSGATWTATGAPYGSWTAIASSADGNRLLAADGYYGHLCTFPYSGPWRFADAPTNYWRSVASSADGTKLVALGEVGEIYISADSGATWTPAGAPAVFWWSAVASSADGSNIVAVAEYGPICTLRSPAPAPPLPPSPELAVGLSGATVGLSWLVPSTRFGLQQNSDLGSTTWVDVPTTPTLDYTNLHHRLTLTPSLGSSFYRLKQQ